MPKRDRTEGSDLGELETAPEVEQADPNLRPAAEQAEVQRLDANPPE